MSDSSFCTAALGSYPQFVWLCGQGWNPPRPAPPLWPGMWEGATPISKEVSGKQSGAEQACLPQQHFLKELRSPHLRPGRPEPLAPWGFLSQDWGPAGPGRHTHTPRTPSGWPAPRFTGEGPEAQRGVRARPGWAGPSSPWGPRDSLGPRWLMLGANSSAREACRPVPGVGTPW